jgi:hypothetical protein
MLRWCPSGGAVRNLARSVGEVRITRVVERSVPGVEQLSQGERQLPSELEGAGLSERALPLRARR